MSPNTKGEAMKTDTRANRIIMSRVNEFIYDGNHVWAPIAKCATKDLETMIDAVGADMINVQFKTISDEKVRAQDHKTFTRRLSKLSPRYVVGPFVPKVIDGYVITTTFVATVNRV